MEHYQTLSAGIVIGMAIGIALWEWILPKLFSRRMGTGKPNNWHSEAELATKMAFEKWAREINMNLTPGVGNNYALPDTQAAWLAWQFNSKT